MWLLAFAASSLLKDIQPGARKQTTQNYSDPLLQDLTVRALINTISQSLKDVYTHWRKCLRYIVFYSPIVSFAIWFILWNGAIVLGGTPVLQRLTTNDEIR